MSQKAKKKAYLAHTKAENDTSKFYFNFQLHRNLIKYYLITETRI